MSTPHKCPVCEGSKKRQDDFGDCVACDYGKGATGVVWEPKSQDETCPCCGASMLHYMQCTTCSPLMGNPRYVKWRGDHTKEYGVLYEQLQEARAENTNQFNRIKELETEIRTANERLARALERNGEPKAKETRARPMTSFRACESCGSPMVHRDGCGWRCMTCDPETEQEKRTGRWLPKARVARPPSGEVPDA